MIPLKLARSSRFSSGNVAVIVNDIFSLCVLGAAIKSCLVAAVNFPYQDSFSLAKGLNFRIAFPSGINRSSDEADQCQYDRKGRNNCEKYFD